MMAEQEHSRSNRELKWRVADWQVPAANDNDPPDPPPASHARVGVRRTELATRGEQISLLALPGSQRAA